MPVLKWGDAGKVWGTANTWGTFAAGNVVGQGTLTGALATAIQLGSSVVGQATAAAALSTAIQLAGSITAFPAPTWAFPGRTWGSGVWGPEPAAKVSASLTTATNISGAISGLGALAASLSTGIQLAGAIAGQGTLAAALSTSIRLVGAVPSPVWGGGVWGSGQLWGATGGRLAADLTTAIPLAGALSGSGALAGDLSTAVQLSGTVAGQAANSASLTTSIRLAGAVAGRSDISANFPAVSAPGGTLSEGDLMAVDLGTDIGCYPDLDSSFATVTSFKLLGQDLARRFETPRGGLFYDAQYGTDIREMVNDTATLANVQKRQQQIETEAKKDERVQRASALISYFPSSSSATVKLMIETALGPFTYVLNVTGVTVALLKI